MSKKTALIIGGSVLAAGAAYLLFKEKAREETTTVTETSPTSDLATRVAQVRPTNDPSPVEVIKDAAEIIGVGAGLVSTVSSLIAPAAAVSQIGASTGAAALAAGVPTAQVPAVVAASQQAAAGTLAAGGTTAQASVSAASVIGPALGVAVGVVAVGLMVDMAIGLINYEPDKWDYRIMEAQGIVLNAEQISKMNQLIANGFTRYNAFTQVLTPIQQMSIPGYTDPNDPTKQYHNIAPEGEPGIYIAEGKETLFEGLGAVAPIGAQRIEHWKKIIRKTRIKNTTMNHYGLNGQTGNIFDFIDKVTDTYNQYAEVLDPIRDQAIRSAIPGGSVPQTQMTPTTTKVTTTTTTAPGGMSTGMKVAIGVGALAVIGGIIWAVTGKK